MKGSSYYYAILSKYMNGLEIIVKVLTQLQIHINAFIKSYFLTFDIVGEEKIFLTIHNE